MSSIIVEFQTVRNKCGEKLQTWLQISASTLIAISVLTIINKVILKRVKKSRFCVTIVCDIMRAIIYQIQVFHLWCFGYVIYLMEKTDYGQYNLYKLCAKLLVVITGFSAVFGQIFLGIIVSGSIKYCSLYARKKKIITIERMLKMEKLDDEVRQTYEKLISEEKEKGVSFQNYDGFYAIPEKDLKQENEKSMKYNKSELEKTNNFWKNLGNYYTSRVAQDAVKNNAYDLHTDIENTKLFQNVQYTDIIWGMDKRDKRIQKKDNQKLINQVNKYQRTSTT